MYQLRNMFIISSTRNFVNFCLRSIIKRLVSFTFTDALMNCIQSVYCRPLSALKACTPPVNYALLSSRPVAKDLYATALSVCLSVCLWLLPLHADARNKLRSTWLTWYVCRGKRWDLTAETRCLFWRDVAVCLSFTNFCDWPSVDPDLPTAPYD